MSWLHGLRERLRDAFDAARRDDELREEIAYHLDLETRRQAKQGHDPDTARRIAVTRVGSPVRIADAAREVRGPNRLEGGMQDVRYALRALRKNAGFTVLGVLTLALGIGVTTVAYSVLDTVLLRPLPYRDSERLVLIEQVNPKGERTPASFPNFIDWRAQLRGFDGVASEMFPFATSVVIGGEALRVNTMGVSRGFFRVLGAQPAAGREFTDAENAAGGPFAVMVAYDFWKTHLNGKFPIDDIRYGDRTVPVVGVAPRGFKLIGSSEFFFPHEQWPGTCRSCRNYVVVGRLSAGAELRTAQAAVTTATKSLTSTYGAQETQAIDGAVTPLRDYLVDDFRMTLTAILVAAALVLLIACTNLVSAQLARGLARERDVAIRTALGASRARIVRQLFIESGLLAIGGAAAGVLVAFVLLTGVKAVGTGLLPRADELVMDRRMLGAAIAVTALTSLLIGLYPAIRLSQARPGTTLRGTQRDRGQSGSRVWSGLIGFEVAVAVMLAIGAGLMMRTMRNILSNDVGFNPHGLVTGTIVPDTTPLSSLEQIRAELGAIPGARGAALVSTMPLSWGNQSGPVMRPTDAPSKWPAMAGFRVITPEYFAVMQQPVIRGRAFTTADVAGANPVAIITPGVASALWPAANPIGKKIRTTYLDKTWLTVVGVVAEASSWSQPQGQQHEIFVPLAQFPERGQNQLIAVVRTTVDPHAMIPAIRARLHAIAPLMPARFDTIDDRIARTAADRRFAMYAFLGFAVLALSLAGIGIYGVMSYSVAARTHEIGVRLALGATPARVLRLVLGNALTVAVAGATAGALGGWMASRFITSILYGVTRADPVSYSTGIVFLLLAALAGAAVPAFRSSRVDPVRGIRGE